MRSVRSKGVDFAYKELYKRLHMFQDGPRKGDFVSKRSRKVLIEQRYTQMDSTSSVGSYSLLKEKEIFVEAARGTKKGQVFRLGSEGPAISQCQSTISSASGTLQSLEDIRKELQQEYQQKSEKLQQELREKDQKWRSNIKNIKEQMEAAYKARDDAISSYLAQMSTKLGMGPPPSFQTDLSMLALDDEEDGEGAHDDSFIPPPNHHPSPDSGLNPLPPPPSGAAPA